MANYYWVDKGSTFGGGDDPIQAGDKMPDEFQKDARFESFKAEGKISTEKVASKREISELEQLRLEVRELKNAKGEESKLAADNELLLKKLEEGDGSGISQDDLDKAKAESAQADDKLEAIALSVKTIQQGDSKDEIWKALKSIKDLLKEGE